MTHPHTTPEALALLRPQDPPPRYPLWRRALGLLGPALALGCLFAALMAWLIAFTGGPN